MYINYVIAMSEINLIIDQNVISEYAKYYFKQHPKATKIPIAHPYHPSINEWMIMKRPMMNALKQKWKDFIVWCVNKQGYANLRIAKCTIKVLTVYSTNRRHDVDNSVPKFILDGLCESGLIVDDDIKCVEELTLCCSVEKDNPHTEIKIHIKEFE